MHYLLEVDRTAACIARNDLRAAVQDSSCWHVIGRQLCAKRALGLRIARRHLRRHSGGCGSSEAGTHTHTCSPLAGPSVSGKPYTSEVTLEVTKRFNRRVSFFFLAPGEKNQTGSGIFEGSERVTRGTSGTSTIYEVGPHVSTSKVRPRRSRRVRQVVSGCERSRRAMCLHGLS